MWSGEAERKGTSMGGGGQRSTERERDARGRTGSGRKVNRTWTGRREGSPRATELLQENL